MSSSFIISACRTPIGKLLGSLSAMPAPKLGSIAVAEALRRSGLPGDSVDEVILGCVLAAGVGQAPARQAAGAGLPGQGGRVDEEQVCGSGPGRRRAGRSSDSSRRFKIIIAGGMSMSRPPFLLTAREGWKFGGQQVLD